MFCMRLTKMEWIVGSKTLEKLTCKKCGRIQMVDYNMIGPQRLKVTTTHYPKTQSLNYAQHLMSRSRFAITGD